MNTLYVLRHAKSSWDEPAIDDRDRPLSPRGLRAAAKLVEHIKRNDVQPELVLCSPARRARSTLELIRPVLRDEVVVELDDAIYGASAAELLAILARVPEAARRVMVVGHNPGLEDLVECLAGDGEKAPLRQLREKFPTGALATLDLPTSRWRDIAPGRAFLSALVVPKALPA